MNDGVIEIYANRLAAETHRCIMLEAEVKRLTAELEQAKSVDVQGDA